MPDPDTNQPAPASLRERREAGATALERGDVATARSHFESILAERPDHVGGLVGLARCARREGDWEAASAAWAVVLDHHASHERAPQWRRNRIECLLRSSHLAAARDEAERYWDADPGLAAYRDVTRNVADGTQHGLAFDHVLILTYGRSGSTLLQGVLNSINGLLVRGENSNAFLRFFELARTLTANRYATADTYFPTAPWFGTAMIDEEVLFDALRPAARRLLLADAEGDPAVTAIGFKEIRYTDLDDDLPDYLDFLDRLFPNAAFIINTRDHSDTARSAWWADQDGDEVLAVLRRTEAHFTAFAARNPNCFEISYADVVERGPRLHELFAFLGATYDAARIDTVLAMPHSYQPQTP